MNNYQIFALGMFTGMAVLAFILGLARAIKEHRRYKCYEADTAAYMMRGDM